MQKTFNVFIKNIDWGGFKVCSKKVRKNHTLAEIDKDDGTIDCSSEVIGCDVSDFLGTLNIEVNEVIEAKITFKI